MFAVGILLELGLVTAATQFRGGKLCPLRILHGFVIRAVTILTIQGGGHLAGSELLDNPGGNLLMTNDAIRFLFGPGGGTHPERPDQKAKQYSCPSLRLHGFLLSKKPNI